MEAVTSIIDGKEVDAGEWFDDVDPSTGTPIARIGAAGAAVVDAAVLSARRAFDTGPWPRMTPQERGRRLRALGALVARDREELALLESTDTGKPLSQARADVDVAARHFEFYGGAVEALLGDVIPAVADALVYTRREPFGVTAHVVPWNYPIQIGARTLAPAMAAGNCCVLKPAEEAPLTLVRLARLAVEAGIPPGVLNVVTGTGLGAGAPLVAHPEVDHVSFTGSVSVGTQVAAAAAANVVPVSLELGGKSPNIVFPDADLDRALPVVVRSILQNAGQTCSAGSRLLVHRAVHGDVVDQVGRAFESVHLGRGVDDPDLGPLISAGQLATVERAVAEGLDGARLVHGGRRPDDGRLAGGFFFEPTLVDEVDPVAALGQDEVFGPVLAVVPFADEEEAVHIANGTRYGLTAAVWTSDVSRAHRMAAQLRCGQVYVNMYGAGGGVELPFGGVKQSGYGREKGFEALLGFTQVKTVAVRVDPA